MPATAFPNMRGAKWLREASYITDADRERVLNVVNAARECHPGCKVGVRPAAYIGDDSSIVTVFVVDRGAEFIFQIVHRVAA